ncbi:hypothetical protein B0F90DRAFT_1717888 [Multifurca ochricompacta]|uniref:F-box domain-containing protein n=1 Tax=Multifurca ochricompacta TaxID=376703 RepID=A0AAD4M5P2_9AGAM|nr:hypothetical protein B0F90DRAFT_1717888 [Multifurca ochricompacta]
MKDNERGVCYPFHGFQSAIFLVNGTNNLFQQSKPSDHIRTDAFFSLFRHASSIIDGQHLLDVPASSSPLNVNTFPKLPVELLQLIFTFYAESLHPKLVSFRTFPHWLAITYVCRHWRSIVLNHHILWTSITPGLTLRWVKVLMERSGTAPVDVDILVGQSDKRTPIARAKTSLQSSKRYVQRHPSIPFLYAFKNVAALSP